MSCIDGEVGKASEGLVGLHPFLSLSPKARTAGMDQSDSCTRSVQLSPTVSQNLKSSLFLMRNQEIGWQIYTPAVYLDKREESLSFKESIKENVNVDVPEMNDRILRHKSKCHFMRSGVEGESVTLLKALSHSSSL